MNSVPKISTTPKILDGKWLSKVCLAVIKQEVSKHSAKIKSVPGLGVILVGDNPASKTYVASKEKTAVGCGFKTYNVHLKVDATARTVEAAIDAYNSNPDINGILLQLPLPKHLNANPLLDRIRPDKDADGLHPLNQGLLARGEGVSRPCTPLGSMKLIDLALSKIDPTVTDPESGVIIPEASLAGKSALVIGRSILVGKPVALMLLERNATVVMAHSKTPDLEERCKAADIIVAAVGVPRLVKGDWIKPGAIVIDVGMNRLPDGKLCGDVEFEEASRKASAITPVPGGCGPMTIAMLIQNTFLAYKKAHSL